MKDRPRMARERSTLCTRLQWIQEAGQDCRDAGIVAIVSGSLIVGGIERHLGIMTVLVAE